MLRVCRRISRTLCTAVTGGAGGSPDLGNEGGQTDSYRQPGQLRTDTALGGRGAERPHPALLSLHQYDVVLPSVLSPGEEVSCCWDNFRDSFPPLLSLNSLLRCAY